MINAIDSGSNGSGSSLGQEHCECVLEVSWAIKQAVSKRFLGVSLIHVFFHGIPP